MSTSPEPDPLKAYADACNTLRHYSNASLSVRTAIVVQAIAGPTSAAGPLGE
jgi:hypothetical protein